MSKIEAQIPIWLDKSAMRPMVAERVGCESLEVLGGVGEPREDHLRLRFTNSDCPRSAKSDRQRMNGKAVGFEQFSAENGGFPFRDGYRSPNETTLVDLPEFESGAIISKKPSFVHIKGILGLGVFFPSAQFHGEEAMAMWIQMVQLLRGSNGSLILIAMIAVTIFLFTRDDVKSPNRRRIS